MGLNLLLVLGIVSAACATEQSGEAEDDSSESEIRANTEWATKSWDARADWYQTAQGSHLMDYDVFLALERPGSTARLATRKNLEAKGFVYPPAGATGLTADARLPLGLVKDANESDQRTYVGFTCAACHTGEIRIKGERLLVEGGQPFLEIDAFWDELYGSLAETTRIATKKARFCAALGAGQSGDQSSCETRLAEAKAEIDGIKARNVVTLEGGPGRLDAFSRILNEVFGEQLGGEAPKPVSQPISFPQVWDAPRLSCVQTNCSSSNSLGRNIGETLGVFGHAKLGAKGVTSTAKIENLHRLEKSLQSLESPKWNERLFGAIDPTKRAQGEKLFETYKTRPLGAGMTDPNYLTETSGGRTISVWKVVPVPYKEVGSDPSFIDVHSARMVQKPELTGLLDTLVRGSIASAIHMPPDSPAVSGALAAKKAEQIAHGLRKEDGSVSSLLMLGVVTAAIELTEIPRIAAERGKDPTDLRHELEFYRGSMMDAGLMSYRARPLNGIAFTAPFGNVGAWPTLADVLAPESERPTQFPVRPRSFDPKRVGIDASPARPGEKVFMFDTTKMGNRNTGHLYGVDLPADAKEALIEYVKSI